MEPLTLKQRLAQKNRKLVKTVELDGDKVELRRPSHKERMAVLKLIEDANEMPNKAPATEAGQAGAPAAGNAAETAANLRGISRMVAAVLYDPDSKLRLYDPADQTDVDTIYGSAWLEDVTADAQKAFLGVLKESLEEARGNS
ncbi:hypothetical protein [Comamonas sp. JC664]|uniref:hypothetical protein n=1 Tax=Comamonas sp. JC664 TaxID=2801917 RepID=UPI00174A2C52|nr:hypothetical protein [Comamonas sp. JC664]MBL0698936.1 hypothetical protein [Comamonas sp. JC664]GHG79644.1 hypothetical protein GCM10012319_31710 [Comamonas sp. KCTC 72670]